MTDTNSPVPYRSIPTAAQFYDLVVGVGRRRFRVPSFFRPGCGGPSILFVHGLGGSKENFYAALQHPALADCAVASFDLPGSGRSSFDPTAGIDVTVLAELTQSVANALFPEPYFLAGASMGGLISLLLIRRYGVNRLRGFINIEGNLAPEDCMFSRRVVAHPAESFGPLFRQMMVELERSPHVGDRIIAQHMAFNLDPRAYHAYSFKTVQESDSGRLLEDFLALELPRTLIYGEVNRGLSYLPRLRASAVEVIEIPGSAHFVFYDNPVATYQAIGDFTHRPSEKP